MRGILAGWSEAGLAVQHWRAAVRQCALTNVEKLQAYLYAAPVPRAQISRNSCLNSSTSSKLR
jgi:hypothetical protein